MKSVFNLNWMYLIDNLESFPGMNNVTVGFLTLKRKDELIWYV